MPGQRPWYGWGSLWVPASGQQRASSVWVKPGIWWYLSAHRIMLCWTWVDLRSSNLLSLFTKKLHYTYSEWLPWCRKTIARQIYTINTNSILCHFWIRSSEILQVVFRITRWWFLWCTSVSCSTDMLQTCKPNVLRLYTLFVAQTLLTCLLQPSLWCQIYGAFKFCLLIPCYSAFPNQIQSDLSSSVWMCPLIEWC